MRSEGTATYLSVAHIERLRDLVLKVACVLLPCTSVAFPFPLNRVSRQIRLARVRRH